MLHKRLDYGFNGYQVPSIPRATRSARKRGSSCKKNDDNHMSAIDVLATVVGKLLVEGEDFPSSTDKLTGKEQHAVVQDVVKKEEGGEDNTLKVKQPCDQGSCNKNFFVSELLSKAPIVNLHAHNDACSGFVSVITTSDCKLEDKDKNRTKIEPPTIGKVSISERADKCSLEDPFVCDEKPPALLSSDNSVKFPCGDNSPRGSFPVCRDNLKLVRDDDENSSGCTRPSTLNKASRPPPRIGDRRIRKIIASKYWKVNPKLKDEERFSSDTEPKHVNCDRKNCYKRQRSFRDFPFKKRKLYNCGSVSNFDEGVSSDGISKGPSGDSSGLGATTHGATKSSAFAAGQHESFQPKDSYVKLKIKSLRVPELYIEIPETATVGSLKRTVMEAVTAILSGGLRVGVLVQGKKIRDDSKTLLQTGISHDNKLDALGFTLEPNPSQIPSPICPEDNSFLPPCETPQPLARYPPTPRVVQKGTSDVFLESPVTNFSNLIDSDHDSAPSPPDSRMDKSTTDLRALVAVPGTNMKSLAVVPMQKSQRSDMGLRRIRRPFSVSEVEALVQAVEKLGTGRWRDVKLRAFDNAKHRTYVDLKDKWKTLVHTARISPQQRRGEPVPQELLDRVLTAHAYWSHHQAKQQLKHQSEACLLLS